MAAITGSTYLSQIHINHASTVQFVGLDNKWNVITISLQSCIKADILCFLVCTSGDGGYL